MTETTLLTQFQGACRAAHEQAQMLEDLYRHFSGELRETAGIDAGERIGQLERYRDYLQAALEEQDLLPSRPDPEREGLVEFLAGIKSAFSPEGRPAAAERLATEEAELLRLTEEILEERKDEPLAEARARTREAVTRLAPAPPEEP